MIDNPLEQIAALSRLAALALRHSSNQDDLIAVLEALGMIEGLAAALQERGASNHEEVLHAKDRDVCQERAT